MLQRKLLRTFVVGVGIVGLQLLSASSAFAYFLTITGAPACLDGNVVVSYTAGSWSSTTVAGSNTAVNVFANGVLINTQPFTLPGNSFSGVYAVPAGVTTVNLMDIGAGVWGDGFTGTGVPGTATVTIPRDFDCVEIFAIGRFTGGPNAFEVGGAKVTTGLQIHCHPKDPSINLEINWNGGDNFKLTDVDTVVCSDAPGVTPEAPKSPIDTMVATGHGTFNNVGGYTIEFTLVDGGDGGKDNKAVDQIRLLIYTTGNPADVKLNVPLQNISGGNLQAHYDQPHRDK